MISIGERHRLQRANKYSRNFSITHPTLFSRPGLSRSCGRALITGDGGRKTAAPQLLAVFACVRVGRGGTPAFRHAVDERQGSNSEYLQAVAPRRRSLREPQPSSESASRRHHANDRSVPTPSRALSSAVRQASRLSRGSRSQGQDKWSPPQCMTERQAFRLGGPFAGVQS
ncbi:hypothetical protein BOTBODRAFT_58400 [Botryobasidium botryosum FD-172 SS1]|uniref:Uncharacterized protein n=1 Tax=Botryobasidium botryosum (strain FD-172 SS1) TaxID=930990 RepID=A0A067MDE3_BOTB1|nr:hypothetical protein BOTBODRAFT_58400 [Botryobasidium botryosum FD-172 SS1]